MSAERLRTLLLARAARWPGPIEWLAETASTNDLMKERARSGAPAWSVAIADRQSAGRGRRGNAWASPAGNLHLSLLLPVPGEAAALTLIPLVAGLAVAEAVDELGLLARLKWPNDVLLGERKVAGVLAEAVSNGQGVDSIVLGVGLNLAASPGDTVAATCLSAALQRPIEIAAMAAAVLDRLRDRTDRLLGGERAALLSAWDERARHWWGRAIEVMTGIERVTGTARGIDAQGALLVELGDGSQRAFLSGEARELRLAEVRCSATSSYYQAVEEFFVSRRGDPLFISNADWLLIDGWKKRGIPLRIALRGIADALDGHAHSWSRAQKVGSLAYCASEVDVAAERWQRALALGEEEAKQLPELLTSMADGLVAGTSLGQAAGPLARTIAGELRERSRQAGAARETESWLCERESALREALIEDDGAETVERLRAEIERELLPYRDRMPQTVQDQIRAEALTRGLFEAHRLPRLSLFL